ncbi:MAG: sugar ABC transporter ATP-binding protein [Clostridia bacterium]
MAQDPVIEIRHINKTYSGIRVLTNVDFRLRPGEVHALVGENGAGKSTMIKIMSGVESPDEGGELYFSGKRIDKMTPHRSIALGLSVIYQDVSLFPNLSIAENICKGLFNDKLIHWKKLREKARQALETMQVELDLNQKLEEISIGKKQLVAIARAITFNSKVIVMDEPTAALSSSEVDMLYRIIRSLRDKGVSIIYISHKLDEIFTVADRVSVLRDGEMVATGDISAFDQKKLIHLMVGRELRFLPLRNEEPPSDEVLFEVRGYTNQPHFEDVNFQVRKYEIVGLTGLVGAGRSELAQTVFGLMKPDAGEMYVCGQRVHVKDSTDAIRKGICYLPEDRRSQGLFHLNSMARNISAGALDKVLKNKLISFSQEVELAKRYIDKVSIRPALPEINVESLSGGNQQKALISRWLNADPKVLIVDEPTSGVDVGAKLEIHRLLRELARQGVCVILISSDLSEVFALSDRILVMRAGQIVDEVESCEATQEGVLRKGLLG